MQYFSFDTETWLIAPAQLAPPMVCLSTADGEVLHRRDPACRRKIEQMFDEAKRGDLILVGQNVAYDMGVIASEWPDLLKTIFALYDANRITDTMIRQKLIDIAKGEYRGKRTDAGVWVKHGYGLASLSKRHNYPSLLDKDTWRLRYRELDEVPVRDWPREAVDYPRHDAFATQHVVLEQDKDKFFLEDEFRQARASFALHLISTWGIRTDRVMVERLRRLTIAELVRHEETLIQHGFVGWNKAKGTLKKNVKAAQERAKEVWGLRVAEQGEDAGTAPMTESGKKFKLNKDATKRLDDPGLIAFQRYSECAKSMSHIDELEKGIALPIHTRFDELAETGRTTSSKPNIQNVSVEPGFRECCVPRRGFVYCDADYDGLELRTVAQVCLKLLGESKLAEALNRGADPHSMVGAPLLQVSLEEMLVRIKDSSDKGAYLARQTGKVANFGLAGGLGHRTLAEQARVKYGVTLDEIAARRLITVWHETWPEFRKYFSLIQSSMHGPEYEQFGDIKHLFSNRWRGHVPYTVACNSYFQGLGSDATKAAMWELVKACYVGSGYLYGCRVVNYVHDQFITEVHEDASRECADEKQKIIESAAGEFLPDVPPKAKPKLTRRWSKLMGTTVNKKTGEPVGTVDKNGVWEWIEADREGSTGYAE